MSPAASRSKRIQAGIARARADGKSIGGHGRHLAAQGRAEALVRAERLRHVVDEFRASGESYRQMVARLNARGEAPPSGTGRWHVKTLQRLVGRILNGPMKLTRANIARAITRKSAGVYAVGASARGRLRVRYVGRSSRDLAACLAALVNAYECVAWTYAPSALVAYQMECEMYHAWRPTDNTAHPARSKSTDWKCLVCGR